MLIFQQVRNFEATVPSDTDLNVTFERFKGFNGCGPA